MTQTRKNVLDMNNEEARTFFLKPESFFNASLPKYIDLSRALSVAINTLSRSTLSDLAIAKNSLSNAENVNHKILANKDGNYAWRPLQILHPLVYVDLVNEITKENHWNQIKNCFVRMQADERIECISIPIEAMSRKSDTAETILNWWENLEQAQIKYALDFDYCIHTDITDCYSSIYTHTIPWALHSKLWAKTHRKPSQGIGNSIDSKIQYLQNGQTNGIPQGSVLMDFVAEIVLGYADLLLSQKIQEQGYTDYKILRYRDDYRIFTNSRDQVESIIRMLSEVLSSLNLKLNSNKTFLATDVILDAIKPDKIFWDLQYASFISKKVNNVEFQIGIQKHILQIKLLGDKYPNCGSLNKALGDIYRNRIEYLTKKPRDVYQLISILVGIMIQSPRTIEYCIVILGKIFELLETAEIDPLIDRILRKFVNTPNTDLVEIWLQRLSLIHTREKRYNASICNKVMEPEAYSLWNSEWLRNDFEESGIINEGYISEMSLTTSSEEIDLFKGRYVE